jgi:hypothetical protein
MRKGRPYTARSAPKKPADSADGAAHVRKFMIKLFDREDGMAADWPLIAETLLREAFYALDQSPDDPRVLTLGFFAQRRKKIQFKTRMHGTQGFPSVE